MADIIVRINLEDRLSSSVGYIDDISIEGYELNNMSHQIGDDLSNVELPNLLTVGGIYTEDKVLGAEGKKYGFRGGLTDENGNLTVHLKIRSELNEDFHSVSLSFDGENNQIAVDLSAYSDSLLLDSVKGNNNATVTLTWKQYVNNVDIVITKWSAKYSNIVISDAFFALRDKLYDLTSIRKLNVAEQIQPMQSQPFFDFMQNSGKLVLHDYDYLLKEVFEENGLRQGSPVSLSINGYNSNLSALKSVNSYSQENNDIDLSLFDMASKYLDKSLSTIPCNKDTAPSTLLLQILDEAGISYITDYTKGLFGDYTITIRGAQSSTSRAFALLVTHTNFIYFTVESSVSPELMFDIDGINYRLSKQKLSDNTYRCGCIVSGSYGGRMTITNMLQSEAKISGFSVVDLSKIRLENKDVDFCLTNFSAPLLCLPIYATEKLGTSGDLTLRDYVDYYDRNKSQEVLLDYPYLNGLTVREALRHFLTTFLLCAHSDNLGFLCIESSRPRIRKGESYVKIPRSYCVTEFKKDYSISNTYKGISYSGEVYLPTIYSTNTSLVGNNFMAIANSDGKYPAQCAYLNREYLLAEYKPVIKPFSAYRGMYGGSGMGAMYHIEYDVSGCIFPDDWANNVSIKAMSIEGYTTYQKDGVVYDYFISIPTARLIEGVSAIIKNYASFIEFDNDVYSNPEKTQFDGNKCEINKPFVGICGIENGILHIGVLLVHAEAKDVNDFDNSMFYYANKSATLELSLPNLQSQHFAYNTATDNSEMVYSLSENRLFVDTKTIQNFETLFLSDYKKGVDVGSITLFGSVDYYDNNKELAIVWNGYPQYPSVLRKGMIVSFEDNGVKWVNGLWRIMGITTSVTGKNRFAIELRQVFMDE